MAEQDITGEWTGAIIFGEGYGALLHEKLFFDADITQQGDVIEGIATDTHGVSASPDPASIVGTLTGDKISFIKQYVTSQYYIDGRVFIDDTTLGPEINYTGTFNKQTNTFEGVWEFRETVKISETVQYERVTGEGTWVMGRK